MLYDFYEGEQKNTQNGCRGCVREQESSCELYSFCDFCTRNYDKTHLPITDEQWE